MAERIKRGDRKDGIWLKDLDPLHGFMPYLYPNRADNEAFIQEQIDITALNEYLKKKTVFRYLLANLAGLMVVYACGMIYYYVICNYVINTPIGIWPLILYCFLLAVPGDIALSILGAVVAKRVRPVVMQYLTDPKPIISSVSEETVK